MFKTEIRDKQVEKGHPISSDNGPIKQIYISRTCYNTLHIILKLTIGDKILGANIDENLIWDSHYKYIVKKVSTHLWLLSQISSYLSVKDRLLFYNAYIRPHFDYCSVIWGSSTCSNTDKITKLQRRACKLILRNGYSNLEEAQNRLNMLSFSESVYLQKAKVIYKVSNNMTIDFISKLSKVAKIRNRYNQVPHLTQDTNGKVTNSQKTPQTRAKRSALSQQVTTKHI